MRVRREFARRWNDLELRTKGLIVVALPILPLAFIWVLFGVAILRGPVQTNTPARTSTIQGLTARVFSSAIDATASVRRYVASGDRDALARYAAARDRLPALVAELDRAVIDREARASVAALRTHVDEALAALAPSAAGGSTATPAGEDRVAAADAALERVRAAAAAIEERQAIVAAERAANNQGRGRQLTLLFLLSSIVCTIGGVIAALVVANGVRRRMTELTAHADALAADQPVPDGPWPGDEIGQLGWRMSDASKLLRQRRADCDQAIAQLDELNTTLNTQAAQLQAANRELEAFSYSVSHDLRAPLRAIDGFSQVLEEDQADRLDDSGRDALRRVRAAATRMGTLIDEMLALSRLSRQTIRSEPVDLSAMASGILADLARHDAGRAAAVSVAPNLVATADPGMMRVALENLLDNAWKYTRKTPEARIDVGETAVNGSREFFVRDNGAGFDMAYADKLFGAFQRLHSDRDFEGTGVGLATVQRIVHRHGGRIRAESEVGRGATFYFTLGSDASS